MSEYDAGNCEMKMTDKRDETSENFTKLRFKRKVPNPV
jgi:hypothetical protein